MFTVTFYSYKGGVGRTMAMVNSAVDMCLRGETVVLLDFDLEAPGLDSFEIFLPKQRLKRQGLIDYLYVYIESGGRTIPEINEYIWEADLSPFIKNANLQGRKISDLGRIFYIPAGDIEKYEKIDFVQLYDSLNGFLLFEEFKIQIEEYTNSQFLLIDSRTGLNDTSGICTRQLPDAVALIFFPNEQNLVGLKGIISKVLNEPIKKDSRIQDNLLFVASRVPTGDDEEEILSKMLERFSEELNFNSEEKLVKLYHNDSLSLINQELFIITRPNSTLSKGYEALSKNILKLNENSEIGTDLYLDALIDEIPDRGRALRPYQRKTEDEPVEERVKSAAEHFVNSAAINVKLAHYLVFASRFLRETPRIELARQPAARILWHSIRALVLGGAVAPRLFISEATQLVDVILSSGIDGIKRATGYDFSPVNVESSDVNVVDILSEHFVSEFKKGHNHSPPVLSNVIVFLVNCKNIRAFYETAYKNDSLNKELFRHYGVGDYQFVEDYLESEVGSDDIHLISRFLKDLNNLQKENLLVSIGEEGLLELGEINKYDRKRLYDEAMGFMKFGEIKSARERFQFLSKIEPSLVNHRFNYAISSWLIEGHASKEYFKSVVDNWTEELNRDSNNLQCLGLTYKLLGDEFESSKNIEKAVFISKKLKTRDRVFSCLSYREVPRGMFVNHCKDIGSKNVDELREYLMYNIESASSLEKGSSVSD